VRIALLNYSSYGNAYDEVSNRRLARAAADAGHALDLMDWAAVRLEAAGDRLSARGRTADGGEVDLAACDVLMPRFDARDARDLALVLGTVRWVEALGVPSTPSAGAIAAAEDKVETARRLAALGLPAPRSAVLPAAGRLGAEAPDAEALDAAVAAVGGYPVVVKAPYGWGGRGVALAESRAALRSWLDLAGQLAPNATYLLQARVPHAVSVHVVAAGGRVVADGQKTAAEGEFRTNVRLGGLEGPVRLSEGEREVALRALEGFGIAAGSVDLARGPTGPVILEVNACTGIAGAQDDPIADAFVAAAVALARRPA
jgi:ribosomal protein S6--L-glutamate ligase